MNLLTDDFISTTQGKVSLKTLLTEDENYQLQYYFDETQLAMLQLLSSLTTVVLKPTVEELRHYLSNGISEQQYDAALNKVDIKWFNENSFMRSKTETDNKLAEGPITKLISGIECGTSPNAIGLFSEIQAAEVVCPDCTHVLNYNLHMNIKGECFGPSGATGIRGGGALSTLISADTLKETILFNTIAIDYFNSLRDIPNCNNNLMWQEQLQGDTYYSHKIGLERGLFALAYHIDFLILDESCTCGVCGHNSEKSVKEFTRQKYTGSYGSTKNGRDAGAGWWPHPYTPITIKEEGFFPICAQDQNWQSWQQFSAYVAGNETDKASISPAFVVNQYNKLTSASCNLLIGGNIADQGSIKGRVYDLYSMPANLDKNLSRITQVIDTGLQIKENLSQALNKMFAIGYDKHFISGIKQQIINNYTSNAQQIVQNLLLNVSRKEARELRKNAVLKLNAEARILYSNLMHKYQYDLPLFKALIKGERLLLIKLTK